MKHLFGQWCRIRGNSNVRPAGCRHMLLSLPDWGFTKIALIPIYIFLSIFRKLEEQELERIQMIFSMCVSGGTFSIAYSCHKSPVLTLKISEMLILRGEGWWIIAPAVARRRSQKSKQNLHSVHSRWELFWLLLGELWRGDVRILDCFKFNFWVKHMSVWKMSFSIPLCFFSKCFSFSFLNWFYWSNPIVITFI